MEPAAVYKVKTCASKGCFEITDSGCDLCIACEQKLSDDVHGIRRLPQPKNEKVVDFLWKMLPMSSEHPDMKLTAFGCQSKDNLRELISVMQKINTTEA